MPVNKLTNIVFSGSWDSVVNAFSKARKRVDSIHCREDT